MAIENGNSDLYRDQLQGGAVIDPARWTGRCFNATGILANLAADSAASKYKLCELPSNCILDERTFFDVQNDGFAQIQIGTIDDAAALVDQTKATETIVTPIAQGDANHGKGLWEVLGLAADPGGTIAIYKHAAANATGAGNMPFRMSYLA